jgi:uncharacterized protein (DUF58 family)
MKNRIMTLVLGSSRTGRARACTDLAVAFAAAVEKELAARASNVTEVTLGKNMLALPPNS